VGSYAKCQTCARWDFDRGGRPVPGVVGWMRRLLGTRLANGNAPSFDGTAFDRTDIVIVPGGSSRTDRTRGHGIRKLCQFELGCRDRPG
jgi:endonuclease YncB( thermonuclease family)